jgi:soluble lytic murein transglycosylase
MWGINLALSRMPAARAVLAGAALLTMTMGAQARSQSDDTAMAVPRLAPRGGAGVALPRPLDAVETARIQRIFEAQRKGKLSVAFQESERMDTSTPLGRAMLGYVLSDRYLGRSYHASAAELSGWLIAYADQPDSRAVYQLLLQRLPKGADVPPAPPSLKWTIQPSADPTPGGPDPAVSSAARNAFLERTVRERVEAGQTDSALKLIARTRGLSRSDAAQLRAEVAQALFAANRDEAALELAKSALSDSGGEVGLAAYVAGLAAWRSGHSDEARLLFEAASIATVASPSLRAAGSFWAARTHPRAEDSDSYKFWLLRAAEEPNTFYGLLASRALGVRVAKPASPIKNRQLLGEADIEAVSATTEGQAAFALLQMGQSVRAEALLRRLGIRMHDNIGIRRAVRLVAQTAGLHDLVIEASGLVAPGVVSKQLAAAQVPDLQPLDGFRVDPALIYGLARVESNFDASATSSAGARGLMQLMPVTANFMAHDAPLDTSKLDDPEVNLELGQRYVLYLAQHDAVDSDLIRLLASYNAGPGKCATWNIRDGGDPLLFIEAIPIEQTRVFVQRALAYTWIYAGRLNLPAPSLDELAAGGFPRFRQVSKSSEPAAAIKRVRLN